MGKGSILVNLSGRGDKDLDYIIEKYGFGEKYKDFA
jgi:tryptophan synthase beta chain